MADFSRETANGSVKFHPNSAGAIEQVLDNTSFFFRFYSPADNAIKFKLPTDQRHANQYFRYLIAGGFSVEDEQGPITVRCVC